ncbi:hypothetical protein AAE02nite_35710 [Adhaeribacter aerolatus]|uniref:Secretion system C-terminal sorting domain-containing protein n=1 Tax=Adhaeribacter aerolatus TaxID=670289 RepID=A0A512B273_9BACT|nr:T9SS type A sorting domain-containing protein [Adhaeribacter aerolatus]GEO05907.1 hypothetical protein AAE02nite_35710 [Adhaeribacter aerolatus]
MESFAQTITSWKGTSSNGWYTAANWTNGVPTAASDVFIGDANFTGTYNPVFGSTTTIRSLTLGGTKAASFSLLNYKTIFKVTGDVTIATNGTISNTAAAFYVGGNWNNEGGYQTATGRSGNKTYYATVILNGITQVISGATTFMDLVVNQGSNTTLNNGITVTRNFSVSGTFDPATYLVTLTGAAFNLGSTGTIKIKTASYAGNYTIAPTTVYAGSTVEFAASDRSQTIAAFSNNKAYSTLVISGGTTKTLTSNISFSASSAADGKLLVNNGTLDLGNFTANRGTTTAGGTVNISNGAILKIGGTNTFPANFVTRIFGVSSTIEYGGTNQTITGEAYGNLTLSSGSGAAVKTMPNLPFTIAGNLTSSVGAGTSVSFTAGQNITINGNLVLGANTTFNGGAFTHNLDGDWISSGTFTGNTSTIILGGTGKAIGGTAHTVFNNLNITGSIKGKAANITVAGNLATSGAGTFIHAAEVNGAATSGTLTMTGTGKTISGLDISFDNLTITGTTSSASDLTLTGNLNVSNTASNAFNLTNGTVLFSGTGKTISAASSSSLNFNALRIIGTITTSSSFSIKSDFSGIGVLTATAGNISFTGTSAYAGAHKLFNVALNGTKLQLAANASLGIANSFTIAAGTFDVATSGPNTVEYNGSTQNIAGTTYHTLILAGTGTKTGLSGFTTNGNLQINSGVTFKAGNFTHTIKGNWLNNGAFTADAGIIQFAGPDDAQITGASTFAALTVNKSTAGNTISLNNNVTAATVNMTAGKINTGANVITITGARTGTGIILGTITRTHAFNAGTAYAFESPFNTVTFGTATGITAVTVTVKVGDVRSFPFGGAINRVYSVSVPNGTYTAAALRLHYQDEELNGNAEDVITLWNYGTSWSRAARTANNTTDNWVEQTGLASLTGQWTLSGDNMVMQWTGATSNNWHDPANWVAVEGTTTARVPLSTDIVDIGGGNFINQPVITSNASVKSIQFGSAKNAVLTLSGGDLTVAGNLNGVWSGNATHALVVGNQTLAIGGDLSLSDGTTGQAINLSIGLGTVTVAYSLTQSGNANITFSGAGNLKIGQDFLYTNGNFTSGTGTTTYNGSGNQSVAGNIAYHNLVINKTGGTAMLTSPAAIAGNLSLASGGNFLTNGNLAVTGNVEIGAGTIFNGGGNEHTINGNWINNGTFLPNSGIIKLAGTNNQTISATTFNYLTINKAGGRVTLTGNLILNANLVVEAGALDLGEFTFTRSAVGGNIAFGPNTALYLSGATNFPANFNAHYLDNTSTVYYNGIGTQNVARISYGHLVIQNGNTNAKTLTGSTTVKGNLTIHNGATLHAGSYTLTAQGNLANNGTFNPGSGTVILAGSSKTTDGPLVFNDLTITGSYTLNSGSFTVNNNFYNSGSITAGTHASTFSGNVTNTGSMSSNGSTTFSGLKQQTIQLLGTFTTTASGITYFNGNVAPILNSTSTPTYVSVVINNNAGITASADWTVFGLFKVVNGAAFHGGNSTHYFHGPFVNEGTVTSTGVLNFIPDAAQTLALGTTLNSSGTVRFGGNGQVTIASSPTDLTNIEIANTHPAGITPPLGWNIADELIIKPGSSLNAGTNLNHSLKGNFINDGILNGNTATFNFNPAASVIQGMGTTNFYNVIINDSTTLETDINIKGNFTNNGVLTIENNTVNFDGITAQLINGTAETSFYNLSIANSNARVQVATNINVVNNLTLETGSVLKPDETVVVNNAAPEGTLAGSGTIEVTRILAPSDYIDQYKFSTYDLSTLTVKFSGTAAQSSSLTSFYNLIISNPAGFTLSGPTTVANTLRLENSIINANGNILTVGTGAAAPGSVEVIGTGMVLGKLKRWIPASTGSGIQFPVGTGTTRRMATIQYTTAPSGGTLTAEFIVADPGKRGLPLTDRNSNQEEFVINNIGTSGYWTITAGNTDAEALTGGVYNATFEATNLAGINNLENFMVLKRGNSTQPWNLHGTYAAATGSLTSPVISRTGLTGFSDFALGGKEITTLPVTLTALKAITQGNNAVITWKTAMEIDNQGFYVEVSANGKDYRSLGFVQSKDADARTIQNYQYTDTETGKWGTRYYRLKQVDLNGNATYYGPKVITFKEESNWLVAYPNPFKQSVEVLIESRINQIGNITLHDINGKQIWSTEKHLIQGNNSLKLPLPEDLVKGIYYLRIQLPQTSKSIKLVKD